MSSSFPAEDKAVLPNNNSADTTSSTYQNDNYLLQILAQAQKESGSTSTLRSPTSSSSGGRGSSSVLSPATAATTREFPSNDLKISTWGLVDFYKMSVHLPAAAFENARSIAVTLIPLLARSVTQGASDWGGSNDTLATNTTNTTTTLLAANTTTTTTAAAATSSRFFGVFSEVVASGATVAVSGGGDEDGGTSSAIGSSGSGGGDVLMGLLFAMVSLGTVMANVPSGILARTYPLRYVPLACGVIYGLATLLLIAVFPNGSYTTVYATLVGVCFLWGAAFSPYSVSRLLFVQHAVPKAWRPRLMSMVGGGQRWAMVSGPFVAGLMTEYFPGGMLSALALMVPLVALNMFFLLKSSRLEHCSDDLEEQKLISRAAKEDSSELGSATAGGGGGANEQLSFFEEIKANIFIVLVIGTFAMIIQIMRGNRTMLLTVRALNLGLSPSFMGTILSVSFFVDATFFLLGGYIGSKFGTRFQTVIASGGMGLCFLLLAVPVDGDSFHSLAVFQLVLVSVLFGLANSTGAGLVLSLISSHAPKSKGNGVLTVMRSMQDVGPLMGSLVAGVILEYVSFGWSCAVFGVLGVANAVMAGMLIPDISSAP